MINLEETQGGSVEFWYRNPSNRVPYRAQDFPVQDYTRVGSEMPLDEPQDAVDDAYYSPEVWDLPRPLQRWDVLVFRWEDKQPLACLMVDVEKDRELYNTFDGKVILWGDTSCPLRYTVLSRSWNT